jgi:hypothetical protein
MNNIRTENLGIDAVITAVQQEIYPLLQDRWTNKIDGYGRAYKNISNDGITLEVYDKDGNYKDSFYNDKFDCVFFFIDADDHKTDDQMNFVADVKAVFMVNLDKIITLEGRNDETSHRDAVEFIRSVSDYGLRIKGIEKGITNVFRGINYSQIKFDDIHPKHIFAVKMELSYYLTDKCI